MAARDRLVDVRSSVEFRDLGRDDFVRVGDIDRTERIEVLLEQRGTVLEPRRGTFDAAAWDEDGDGEHSVAAQRRALAHYADVGGVARGAFADARLVGIGVVVPHLRPSIAQLAYLHVTRAARSSGIGTRLCDDLERIAQLAGDTEIVVTATPSERTVRFYLGRGYRPLAEPLPELLALEPDDVHLGKPL
jgi:GNAT superfamily N-acetyltransferase